MPRGTSTGRKQRKSGEVSTKGWAMRPGSQALRNEGRHSTTESTLSVPSCPTRFSLGQRHPLSLQRFTTLRDYFKKLGGTRRGFRPSIATSVSRRSHIALRNIFYAILHARDKRTGRPFLTLFNPPTYRGQVNGTPDRLSPKICGTTLNSVKR